MKTVTHYLIDGVWQPVPGATVDKSYNYLICCQYGDWSGFRSLEACLAQNPNAGKAKPRPNGFYWIERR